MENSKSDLQSLNQTLIPKEYYLMADNDQQKSFGTAIINTNKASPKSYDLKNQLAQQFLIDQNKNFFESNIIILHSRFHSQGLEGYLHG